MATSFSYETVFDASGKRAVLAAYFNEAHLAAQDKVAELCDREVIENFEDESTRKTVWSVRSLRALPIFVRPFVDGGRVTYRETMTWRKQDDEIDMSIVPQILGGRVQITAIYQLADVAPGKVRRRYQGSITADVSLLSGKVERAIAAEIAKGMSLMTSCTQQWLREAGI